jgi:hypothetical protein
MTTDNSPEDGQLTIGSVGLPAGKRIHASTWSTRLQDGRLRPVHVAEQPVAWVAREEVPDAARVWVALSQAHSETGLVPFVLGTLHSEASRPWDQEEFYDPIDPREADQMDAADVLRKRWDGETHESVEPGEDEDPEFLRHITAALAPFSHEFPGLASSEDAVLNPEQIDQTPGSPGARRLGLVPADRPADVLPRIGWTPSDQSDALPVAAVVRSWEDRFGARLLEVGFAEIRLLVQHPPRGTEATQRVAAEHWAFADECGDTGRSSIAEIPAALLRRPAVWQFWWD